MTQEVETNRSLYQRINHIGRELLSADPENLTQQFLPVIERMNTTWQTITVEILSHTRNFDELVKCAEKYNGVKEPLEAWLDEIEARIDGLDEIALDLNVVTKQIDEQKVIETPFCVD